MGQGTWLGLLEGTAGDVVAVKGCPGTPQPPRGTTAGAEDTQSRKGLLTVHTEAIPPWVLMSLRGCTEGTGVAQDR